MPRSTIVHAQRPTIGTREAAALLGVHPQTLYAMVHKGQVPVVRLPSGRARTGTSNRLRFRVVDLERLIAAWTERTDA